MAIQTNTSATASNNIAVTTVGLDPMSYRTLSNFMLAVPGAVMAASLESYS